MGTRCDRAEEAGYLPCSARRYDRRDCPRDYRLRVQPLEHDQLDRSVVPSDSVRPLRRTSAHRADVDSSRCMADSRTSSGARLLRCSPRPSSSSARCCAVSRRASVSSSRLGLVRCESLCAPDAPVAGIGGGGLTTMSSIVTSDLVSVRERGTYQVRPRILSKPDFSGLRQPRLRGRRGAGRSARRSLRRHDRMAVVVPHPGPALRPALCRRLLEGQHPGWTWFVCARWPC